MEFKKKFKSLRGIFLSLFLLPMFVTVPSEGNEIICYFENWAQYRAQPTGTPPSCVPSSLMPIANMMTCLNYSFLLFNIDASVNPPTVTNDWTVNNSEWNDPVLLQQAVALKTVNPKLKIFITLGGWNFNDPNPNDSIYGPLTFTFFSNVVANSTGTNRQDLINSIAAYLIDNHLDGVDLDWEYPGQSTRGGSGNDYANLLTFISDLRAALTPLGLMLTMAVPPFLPTNTLGGTYPGGTYPDGSTYAGGTVTAADTNSYFIWYGKVAGFLDWINVMTYDINGPWSAVTGYNSPVFPANQPGCAHAAALWTTPSIGNVPFSKFMLGVAAYGHTFAGVQFPSPKAGQFPNSQFADGCNFSGAGPAGIYTQQPGVLAYFEIANDLFPPTTFQGCANDFLVEASYGWNAPLNLWVSFDTPAGIPGVVSSVEQKAQFVLNFNLGGCMIYAISEDVYWQGAPIMTSVFNIFHPPAGRELIQRNVPQ